MFSAIADYLRIVASLKLETEAYAFVAHWIERASTNCASSKARSITGGPGRTLQQLAGYVAMDDRLWDLENRVELHAGPGWTTEADDETVLRFGAFIAAYNGDAHDASLRGKSSARPSWPSPRRVRPARWSVSQSPNAAGLAIPEELSTAVKLARQAAQMAAKQQGLRAPSGARRLANWRTC